MAAAGMRLTAPASIPRNNPHPAGRVKYTPAIDEVAGTCRASRSIGPVYQRPGDDWGLIMTHSIRNMFLAVLAAGVIIVAGCSTATTIKSDLVLEPSGGARIHLRQPTKSIDILNDSDADVRVLVLGKGDRILSDMFMGSRDQARLDLTGARAIRFDNDSYDQAVIRWTLRNDGRIEYSLTMAPTAP